MWAIHQVSTPTPRSALVVDDEPLARLKLKDLLERTPWLRWAGEAANVPAARAAIARLRPDVLFLDISLPGESGLDLANELSGETAVVFTTAFDRYAVDAFDLGATDYLLKPFGRDRFDRALERLRNRLDQAGRLKPAAAFLERLFARTGNETHCIRVDDIERFEAQDDYLALHVGRQTHLIHMTMNALESRLDPSRFRRTHRSHLVNLRYLVKVSRGDGAGLAQMSSGAAVPISRSRMSSLGFKNPAGAGGATTE